MRPAILWLALLGAILCMFGTHVGRTWDFTVDDAAITYSYARNVANGHGFVLTPGSERVEAATNLLWVLLLVPAELLHVSHEALSKVLGVIFAGGALGAIAVFPSVAYRREPRYFDLVAPLVASTFAHSALWATSGLENGLFQFLAALSLVALAWEENDTKRIPWSSLVLVALFATRPDGALYSFALGGAKFMRAVTGRASRQDARWVLLMFLGVGGIELFRVAYFAWPVPNSFYTKKRTFEFGKDLTDIHSAGWTYVIDWAKTYKVEKAVAIIPGLLIALRAPVARVALLLAVAVGFFFPVYSHGDWMEEWRFLTYVLPLFALATGESLRALARIVTGALPRRFRPVIGTLLALAAGYLFIKETTKSYPDRFDHTRAHNTLDFATVRGRARYFAAAARLLEVRDGSLLDPDVGGTSYDSGLRVIDLYGLGDIAIAHTHGVDEPGLREAIFRERRPTFVHLHGAWFAAVMLDRLEELEQLYFHLPGVIASEHDDGTNYVRRETLAAPWTEESDRGPAFSTKGAGWPEGYTLAAYGTDPTEPVTIEVSFANAPAATLGIITAIPADSHAREVSAALHLGGDLIPASAFWPGERPWARARLTLPRGRYEIRWKSDQAEATLGTIVSEPGEGHRDAVRMRDEITRHIQAGRLHEARMIALRLRLRQRDLPDDPAVREGIGRYARALAERARKLGEHGVLGVAAELAQQSRAFTTSDATASTLVQQLSERLADESRVAERRGAITTAFTLARDSVLMDPRRSWMRRRAENLRIRRRSDYDGGRELAAYRSAAVGLASTASGPSPQYDDAILLLGSTERAVEASLLVDRTGIIPQNWLARLTAARGYLARGEVFEAHRLAVSIPCATARDRELLAGLRALMGRAVRPGDPVCERAGTTTGDAPWLNPPAPLNAAEGSFESGRFTGWTVTGTAFGASPIHDAPSTQTFVNGWRGRWYASSFSHGTDTPTGLLRSRPFVITTRAISFLIAGGMDEATLGARLVIDGNAVLHHTGHNTEGFRRVFWDVTPYVGQTAVIEVFDDHTGAWGHVMVDDFVAEPALPAP
jgi:hypothetical protein